MPVKKKQTRAVKIVPFQNISCLNMVGKGSDASILCSVSDKIADWSAYQINVSDCDQKARLHGSLKTPENRQNALHKIDALINSLTEMRTHLINEFNNRKLKY